MTATTFPIHISWSSNSKTGKMPVSTSGSITCPTKCTHLIKKTCYAKYSFLGIHWRKVDTGARDMGWNNFLQFIQNIPNGTVWRHNQAGDLPGIGNQIDNRKLLQLIDANLGKNGFTYTHKPLTPKNLSLVHYANTNGFTINVSADDIDSALSIYNKGRTLNYMLPVVVTVAHDWEPTIEQPLVKLCPQQIRSDVQCAKCQWCAMPDRKFIVAFKAHGCKARSY